MSKYNNYVSPFVGIGYVQPNVLWQYETAEGKRSIYKLEILQSLGGLYDGLAFYPLHWS